MCALDCHFPDMQGLCGHNIYLDPAAFGGQTCSVPLFKTDDPFGLVLALLVGAHQTIFLGAACRIQTKRVATGPCLDSPVAHPASRTTQMCCVARHAERADAAYALYKPGPPSECGSGMIGALFCPK